MRITVIGGGIIGLSCAWRLAGDGHAVTLLDAAPEAREASWAAAGMLAPHHEASATDALWRLMVESLARWPGFARAIAGDPAAIDLREHGGLEPALDQAEAAELERKRRLLADAGVAARWLERDDLAREEPRLAAPRALLLPGGHVDPRLANAALRRAAAARGVDLRYGAAARALAPGAVELGDGRLEHDLAVLASGAWTPALAALVGLRLPGEPVKGQLLRLACDDGVLVRFVHSRHAYLVPRRGAGVVVGASMVCAGFDRGEDPAMIAALAANARRLVPALAGAAVVETWTGLRPRLAHGRPVIARARDDLIVATGHFRNGVLLTPATAEAVAALAAGREPPFGLGEFALPST